LHFTPFSTYDTDLDPMTFRYELDLHSPEDLPAYENVSFSVNALESESITSYKHSALRLNVKGAD